MVSSPLGGVSLALSLVAAATVEGAWAAAVGLPSLGLLAAAELGVRLERLALVPVPGDRWPVVVAALLDGMDLLLLGLPGRARATDARRLIAQGPGAGDGAGGARATRITMLAGGFRSPSVGRSRRLGRAGMRARLSSSPAGWM